MTEGVREGTGEVCEGRGEGASCEGRREEGGSEERRDEGVSPALPGARRLLEIVNCPVNVFVICLFEVQY